MSWMSTYVVVDISPETTTRPVLTSVSQATREAGSSRRQASRTPSEIWSATLSGWPSVTDSEVKRYSLSESTGVFMSGRRVQPRCQLSEKRLGLRRQLEVFAGLDHEHGRARERRQAPAGIVADPLGVLADSAGEDEHVDPARRRDHRGDLGPQTVDVHVVGQLRPIVAVLQRFQQLAHVARAPAEPGDAGAMLERVVELLERDAGVALEPDQQAGIDAARAGGHDEALERREAHRRVDRAAARDRAQRRARAE